MSRFNHRCNLIINCSITCVSTYSMYLLYPFTSILHLFGVTWNGSSHSFPFFPNIPLFFYFKSVLLVDLHRHLFLLVLFLLCGCDYNQEMEIQKSTCYHSKYVLFQTPDLLSTFHVHLRSPVFVLHGCIRSAVLWCELAVWTVWRVQMVELGVCSPNSSESLSLFWGWGGLLQLPFPFFSLS